MLFSLLSDMPDMIEELRNWQPLSYEKHFARSGFQAKDWRFWRIRMQTPPLKARLMP
jgi:hypothetical protein